jgi:hypothetical protein
MRELLKIIYKPWLTIFTKNVYTLLGKPYLKVIITNHKEEMVGIDAHFNVHFIYNIDQQYLNSKVTGYNTSMPENEKIAFFLHDSIIALTEKYLPPLRSFNEEDIEDAPPMSFRDGGEPVKQVVDLADRGDTSVEIERG